MERISSDKYDAKQLDKWCDPNCGYCSAKFEKWYDGLCPNGKVEATKVGTTALPERPKRPTLRRQNAFTEKETRNVSKENS